MREGQASVSGTIPTSANWFHSSYWLNSDVEADSSNRGTPERFRVSSGERQMYDIWTEVFTSGHPGPPRDRLGKSEAVEKIRYKFVRKQSALMGDEIRAS